MRAVALACFLAALLGAARASSARKYAREVAPGPFYRAVDPSGAQHAPGAAVSCPLTGAPPTAAPVSAMQGTCGAFSQEAATCCPSDPDFYQWLRGLFADFVDDACCRRNLERAAAFAACSTGSAMTTERADVAGKTVLRSYISDETAQAIYSSCSNSCSGRAVSGDGVDAFLAGLATGADTKYEFSFVRGQHPETKLAMDMNVLESCAAGHTTSSNCSGCFSPAPTTRKGQAVPATAIIGGTCGADSSEMSGCCVHDSGFEWANSLMFPLGATECLSNIKRLHCACLCPETAPYVDWATGNAVCRVAPEEAAIAYRSCASVVLNANGRRSTVSDAFSSVSEFIESLAGKTPLATLSLVVASEPSLFGVVASQLEDSDLPTQNAPAPTTTASGTTRVTVIGLGVAIPIVVLGGIATAISAWAGRGTTTREERKKKNAARLTALASSFHPRLGEESPVALMGYPLFMDFVAKYVCPMPKEILQHGTGERPKFGQYVTMHCVGTGKHNDLTQEFWSTRTSGKPYTFRVGYECIVIKGFEDAVADMRVGEKAKILLPSELGYGKTGNKQWGIEPDTPLLFEMELLSSTDTPVSV